MISMLKTPSDVIPLLEDDTARHAFHISLTEDPYKDFTIWVASYDDAWKMRAAVVLYCRCDPCVVLTAGSAEGVTEIFSHLAMLPPRVSCYVPFDHVQALSSRYRWKQERSMVRMQLDTCAFIESGATSGVMVEQLVQKDLPAIKSLYQHAERFCVDGYQLLSGNYYGVRSGQDIISSAAVHCMSKEQGVAVVGNVVTHPSHRRGGLAAECLATTLDSLLPAIDTIVLTVEEENQSARALYEKMGFVEHSRFVEGRGRLFRPTGKIGPPSRLKHGAAAVAVT